MELFGSCVETMRELRGSCVEAIWELCGSCVTIKVDVYFIVENLKVKSDQELVVHVDGSLYKREGFFRLILLYH